MMQKIKQGIPVIFGVFLVAFAVSVFYAPNKIVSGGLSGFSTILLYTANIPLSVTNAVANVILILLGIRILGKNFIIKTLVCSLMLAGFMEICSHIPPITDNVLLSAVFGGVLYGFGIGLALSGTASTGGTDILARIAQHIFPHIAIGKLLLVIDGVVILASFFVFRDMELILFGILALITSSYAIDTLIHKLNISKLAFVITEKGEEVAKYLVGTSPRGVTVLDVKGAYSGENKKMLICALKEREMPLFQQKISELDKNAFTIFSESQQIVGNGFHVYR